jgi:hypothetical protein
MSYPLFCNFQGKGLIPSVTLRSVVAFRCFGGKYCCHLQIRRVSELRGTICTLRQSGAGRGADPYGRHRAHFIQSFRCYVARDVISNRGRVIFGYLMTLSSSRLYEVHRLYLDCSRRTICINISHAAKNKQTPWPLIRNYTD